MHEAALERHAVPNKSYFVFLSHPSFVTDLLYLLPYPALSIVC